ncbi:hypothetical protein F5050DRAFT_1812117 [Lentinula boryana]|uniref:Uncharacterized protein n=1 Tax=Lentinula boryana TaxID=40481 RepID=A0ABQ8PZE4_9AGAR|nr:hypothetical protein F5050DRAFT_1812117 [Lentinula boryana]
MTILKQLTGESMVLFKEKINYKQPCAGGYRAHIDSLACKASVLNPNHPTRNIHEILRHPHREYKPFTHAAVFPGVPDVEPNVDVKIDCSDDVGEMDFLDGGVEGRGPTGTRVDLDGGTGGDEDGKRDDDRGGEVAE